jgi:beta-phosphoglucomutase-like phosphatase (HAD superfamily)
LTDGLPARVRVLLCDADDCLFPSERPAFEASAEVTNRLLATHEVDVRFAPDELRRAGTGKNFRATATDLAARFGFTMSPDALESWVQEERRQVTAHLAAVLRPDPAVRAPVGELADRYGVAVVTSSALARLDSCLHAAGLAEIFPPERRFSAEDSLPEPTSKPDPAVYALAGAEIGVSGADAVAVEDSVSGVRSATGAGFPTIGNLLFVPEAERRERGEALLAAGATMLVHSWHDVRGLLDG